LLYSFGQSVPQPAADFTKLGKVGKRSPTVAIGKIAFHALEVHAQSTKRSLDPGIHLFGRALGSDEVSTGKLR
jgi:hypothetical protein